MKRGVFSISVDLQAEWDLEVCEYEHVSWLVGEEYSVPTYIEDHHEDIVLKDHQCSGVIQFSRFDTVLDCQLVRCPIRRRYEQWFQLTIGFYFTLSHPAVLAFATLPLSSALQRYLVVSVRKLRDRDALHHCQRSKQAKIVFAPEFPLFGYAKWFLALRSGFSVRMVLLFVHSKVHECSNLQSGRRKGRAFSRAQPYFYCVQNIPKEDPFSYSALTHEILLSTHAQVSDKKTVEVLPSSTARQMSRTVCYG